MKKKYLPLYKKWIKVGKIPSSGLCYSLGNYDKELFYLLIPDHLTGFWGYWSEFFDYPVFTQHVDDDMKRKLMHDFNPLRQNIVLFMAAMNNEL